MREVYSIGQPVQPLAIKRVLVDGLFQPSC